MRDDATSRRATFDDDTASFEARLRRRFRVEDVVVPVGGREIALMHPASAEDLIDEAAFEKDERLPYWADVWPSARVLASHLLPADGRGKRLLELGCGAGLVSTCAALAGFAVTATDYYEDALRFTRVNVRRNAGVDAATRLVDWRRFPSDLGTFDLVVASDVLYEKPYAQLVAAAYERTLAPGGFGLLADPGRLALDDFVQAARKLGLRVDDPEQVPYVDGQIRQNIRIFTIVRR